jgi:hypothetical protein
MKFKPFLLVATLFAVVSVALAGPIDDRLDAINREVAAIRAILNPPATPPATQPATQPTLQPVRADNIQAVQAAINAGAKWIQTAGFDLTGELDGRDALIELLPGGPNWKPAIQVFGNSRLSNVRIKTPPSTFNAKGERTGFWKAIQLSSRTATLENVTFAPDTGFCLHVSSGDTELINVNATTFSEYFVYQEAGSYVRSRRCKVVGGSKAESVYRTSGGRFLLEECLFDNSQGGKAALRGDCPAWPDGSPGGVVRNSTFIGQVGLNPLTEDDGGQAIGIDRWRIDGQWLYQLDGGMKAEAVSFAQAQRARGFTPWDIVRSAADKFIKPAELKKLTGRERLTDKEIDLTMAFRASELGRKAVFLIEDSTIRGDLRLNARSVGTIRRASIIAGATTPISGASQTTYPWPLDRVLSAAEVQPAPVVNFDLVTIDGGQSIGIDLKAYPGLKFNASTYKGTAIIEAARNN